MARRRVTVTPDKKKGDWKVTEGDKTISRHQKKETAVDRGRREAKKDKPSQLVIKKQDGTIQTEHTYKDDPYPPPG